MARRDPGEGRLEAAAAVALAGVASAHGQALGHKLEEAPYVAALFGGLVVAATALAAVLASGRGSARAWGLAGGLALGALTGYVASRTLGLPQLADHVGHWLDPAALASLVCETAVVGLWVARSRRLRAAARRASPLALPEPAIAWRAVVGAAAAVLVLVSGGGAVQDALAGGRLGAHAAGAHDHAGHAHGAEDAVHAALAAAHAHPEEGGGGAHAQAHPEAGGRGAHAQAHPHAHEGSRGRAHAAGGVAARGHAGHRHAGAGRERARAHRHPAAEDRESAPAPHLHERAGHEARRTAQGGHEHGAQGGDGAHGELLVTARGAIASGRPAPLRLAAATPAQRASAQALLDAAHMHARSLFPDVAAARRRGYVMAPSAARARLVHLNHAGRAADDHVLDPARPESLVYLRRPGRPLRLVAFMFRTRTGRPPAASPLVRWHVHGWCTAARTRRGSGVTVPHGRCGPGRVLHHGTTMMFHLWLASDLRDALALQAPAAVLAGGLAPPGPATRAARPSAPRADRVVRVVSGDVLELERLGTARIAGIRAPAGAEPCAAAARGALEALLGPGSAVDAVWEAPREDAEGRVLVTLRHAQADVAAGLVRAGLAVPAADPVARHAGRLEAVAAHARAAGRGVWAPAPACL